MRPNILVQILMGIILAAMWIRPALSAQWFSDCKNIDYLTDLSDLIVKGKVVKVEKMKDDKGRMLSFVDIKVNKYILGNGANMITVKKIIPAQSKGEKKSSSKNSNDFSSVKEGQEGYLYLANSQDKNEIGKFFQPVCDAGVIKSKPNVVPEVIYYAP